jgi:hypothetical protein
LTAGCTDWIFKGSGLICDGNVHTMDASDHTASVVEVRRLGAAIDLNGDYFTVQDEELKRLRSVLAVVGRRVVHSEL